MAVYSTNYMKFKLSCVNSNICDKLLPLPVERLMQHMAINSACIYILLTCTSVSLCQNSSLRKPNVVKLEVHTVIETLLSENKDKCMLRC
jgi:hypothetical protein